MRLKSAAWRLRRAPIRVQLSVLVLAAALPAFTASIWYLLSTRDDARAAAHQRVQLLVGDASERLRLVLDAQERLMLQLASQPRVKAMDPEDCDPIIREFGRLQPDYLVLVIRDTAGNPICSLRPAVAPREQVAGQPWFRDSLRSDALFAGDAVFAPIAKRWISPATVPVRADNGERRGLVVLPVDLLYLNERVMRGLPPGVVVTVSDRAGKIVLRSSDPEAWISKPAPELGEMDSADHGMVTLTDAQGLRRVVAYKEIPDLGWRVAAEMPESDAFQEADRVLRNGVLGCVAILLGILLLTWRMGRGIVGPMEALAQTAQRVAGGNAAARAPTDIGPPELGSAAHAINLMLDASDKSRQELQASEERLATTLRSIGDGVLAVDAQGLVVRMNPAAEQITGWRFAEAQHRPLAEVYRLCDPQTRVALPDPVQQALQSGRMVVSSHSLLVLRDGREVDVAGSAAPMRDTSDQVVGVVLVFGDVSLRVAVQRELREAYNYSRQIIDHLPLGLSVRDREGRFVEWNPGMQRIRGYTAEQMLGKRLEEALPGQPAAQRDAVNARMQRALAGETVVRGDTAEAFAKHQTWSSAVQGPLRNAEGEIVGVLTVVQDITERKEAELALRRSEEQVAITLQSIGDAVIATDPQGMVTRMNPVAERLTGWTLEAALGRPLSAVFRIVNATTREPSLDPVQRVIESGEVVGLANHTALLSRDGSEYQIADSAAPIRDGSGTVLGVVLVFSDVTEQYRLQASVRESELRYRGLVEHSPVGVFVHHRGILLFVNPEAARLFGAASPEALVGASLLSLIPADLHARVSERMEINLATREGLSRRQTRFLRVDGSEFHVELHTTYVEFGGQPAMHAAFLDTTERTRALEALRQSEENLEITLQSIGDAVVATDAQGRVTRMNPVAEQLTAWTLEEARGLPLSEVFRIVNAQTRALAADPVQRVLESGQVVGLANHTALLARDGAEYQISDSAAPIRGADGHILGVVLVFSDVTERYRLQNVLEESEHRYRGVVETTPVGIVVHRHGSVIYANPMAVDILGAARQEDLLGRTANEIVHSSYHHLMASRAQQVDAGVVRLPMAEWQYVRLDGSVIDVQAQASAITIQGELAIQVSFMDITPRKRAERVLRENEARYRALTQLSSDWYWEQDAQFRFVRVDGKLHELIGRPNDAYLGQTWWGLGEYDLTDAEWEQHRALLLAHQEFRDFQLRGLDPYGRPFWMAVSGTPVFDAQGEFRGYHGIGRNVTEQKLAADKIHALAFYDALTELPNRRLLVEQLKKAVVTNTRNHRHAALLFIDLDNFKTLNDTQGHEIGDMLLRQVARRLQACVREADSVARLGGDEFVVMIEDLSDDRAEATAQATLVGQKVLSAFAETFVLSGREYRSTPSIGMTLFGDGQRGVEDLLKQADLAMYQAKAAGRNTMRLFDQHMQAAVDNRAALESDLRAGIVAGQMLLYFQPVVRIAGEVSGAEALVRWHHPVRGMVPPSDFIGIAETTRLILPLGQWVLDQACAQLAAWGGRPQTRHLTLAVNVSAHQFTEPDFVPRVLDTLDAHGADPRMLKLELTESLLADNVDDIVFKMKALRERGVEFALDDFGTGYSSLSYLKKLPLTHLKIDQSFVRDVLVDANVASIARTIVALGANLGMNVVAEGVETEGQREFLVGIGCNAFQGYLYGRPVAIAEFEALHLAQRQSG